MKMSTKLRTAFKIGGFLVIAPNLFILFFLLYRYRYASAPWFLPVLCVLQLLIASIGLSILYRKILRPVTRLKETVSQVLVSADLANQAPQDVSLFDYFQTLMDREYASRITSREAELDALQSQINPHFLYNTLECIRGQAIVEGADTISDMARSLSEYFRYSINRKEKLVLVSDELRNVEAYIKIQNYRFSNKFFLRVHIDEEDRSIISRCQIPRLTLQPIIENAVLHGVRDSERELEYLDIFIDLTDSRMLVRVCDYGVGIPQERLDLLNAGLCDPDHKVTPLIQLSGNGIALGNINERIQLLFGSMYGLHIQSTPGMGTTIEITLPRLETESSPSNPLFPE